eukprot:CAMPEP_0194218386 /NCGR_PEP_ID=MMETSP0156-20130528/23648_1 /TAXON_ID=33649 /ORGANISM="Thalassionema nitzschioides, Strain L26-B" /LENGTH=1017 /DNA_ID=CAMNT_0038947713 /DNA_START=27 /DNA_END=3080 /DNA_ORIENTATION=-
MVDVAGFLIRWLYLCGIARDIAEVQLLPQHQPNPFQHSNPSDAMGGSKYGSYDATYHTNLQQNHYSDIGHASSSSVDSAHFNSPQSIQNQPPITPDVPPLNSDLRWKDRYFKAVVSYPAGSQRLYALDALRIELIQQFAQHLRKTDNTLKRYSSYCNQKDTIDKIGSEEDPFLDADLEIVRAFELATSMNEEDGAALSPEDDKEQSPAEDAVLVISDEGADVFDANEASLNSNSQSKYDEMDPPSDEELESAYHSMSTFREYLPQLVSAVLSSPGAMQPALLDPIIKFRQLLLTRCLQDPNWGIEFCWLLEAEVGRAWKTLFEHRQQTGRRLIVVLPAEKAAVLAKIGTAKRAAFELLQDVEQATAYGCLFPTITGSHHVDPDLEPHPALLPSSLSLRRCSHFGDTMHFVDRLSRVSLDLQRVPAIHRQQSLIDSMEEMNRRLRRRMVTKGDVSLDVEDNSGPDEWPHISDVSADVIKYSVHFPLEPKRVTWPGGEFHKNIGLGSAAERSKTGVMRVLNIVSSECRVLDSRERCPYLVHLEVAETGMEGNDARLYTSGVQGIGTTIGESLSMPTVGERHEFKDEEVQAFGEAFPRYKIPSELLVSPISSFSSKGTAHEAENEGTKYNKKRQHDKATKFPSRGGWQSDELYPEEGFGNPYEMVRQTEYEQLHQQLFPPQPQQMPEILPTTTTKRALLDRVFGLPWSVKCEQIRQASPYGKVKGWRLASFIMKAGEDIRREALVMQVISKLNEWFQAEIPESHRPKMRPYSIMCVGGDAGLLECLSDAKSVDEVKKKTDGFTTLRNYFERAYGAPISQGPSIEKQNKQYTSSGDGSDTTFEMAQDNFLRSLVGYSLVCYIMQIKDRHNANILMDREGHIVHIDFGFVLGDTPKMGKVPLFSERAPFKLSAEFWEVLGGWNFNNGGLGVKFCKMFEKAFACASLHSAEIVSLVESALINLTGNPTVARLLASGVKNRLTMRGLPESVEQKTFIMNLVNTALTSWGTTTYDWLQKNMNGYQ